MIISASRRTDIPAFYSDWFFNRIEEQEVLIRNPFNKKQISRIVISPETVDCFIFWTKDPYNFINHHKFDILKQYRYYFQFTLNSYRENVEKNLRKKNDIIKTFKELSNKVGKDRVIWRYDPILINDFYTKEYHYKWFDEFSKQLEGYTEKCVISFIDDYKETKRNQSELSLQKITNKDMTEIAKELSAIAEKYDISIESCAEEIDLERYGIRKGSCIDPELISKLSGICPSEFKTDNMRKSCGCVKSIDIGQYNTCLHKCRYCYANYNASTIDGNFKKHDNRSKVMIGDLSGDEKITDHHLYKKKLKSLGKQINFLGEF